VRNYAVNIMKRFIKWAILCSAIVWIGKTPASALVIDFDLAGPTTQSIAPVSITPGIPANTLDITARYQPSPGWVETYGSIYLMGHWADGRDFVSGGYGWARWVDLGGREIFSFNPTAVGAPRTFLTMRYAIGLNDARISLDFIGPRFAGDTLTIDAVSYAAVGSVVPSVPEPATWAMMLIGFAGLAFAARRRERSLARQDP
jgi:PEP-CTERM motif